MSTETDRANERIASPHRSPARARELGGIIAESFGWFLGQTDDPATGKDRKTLYRNGLAPIHFGTWLKAYTWLRQRAEDRNQTRLRQRAEAARPKPILVGTVVSYVPTARRVGP